MSECFKTYDILIINIATTGVEGEANYDVEDLLRVMCCDVTGKVLFDRKVMPVKKKKWPYCINHIDTDDKGFENISVVMRDLSEFISHYSVLVFYHFNYCKAFIKRYIDLSKWICIDLIAVCAEINGMQHSVNPDDSINYHYVVLEHAIRRYGYVVDKEKRVELPYNLQIIKDLFRCVNGFYPYLLTNAFDKGVELQFLI